MNGEPSDLLAEQVSYYRALAPEYESGGLDFAGAEELDAALEAFDPGGDILELACGPGSWTKRLLQDAETLTAVDAAPEMLARAAERIGDDPRARFVQADLFEWRPDSRFDVVFFGFWLSHVPLSRFESFWEMVAACLRPDGRVFFADDGYRTAEELIAGEQSSTIRRRLADGTSFRAVKVPHAPPDLEQRLRGLGWSIEVRQTRGPFYWGAGTRAT